MAVSAYSYGTVALVHDKIGWIVPGLAAFSASTMPAEAEVEAVLDAIANEIHAVLMENGYPADTKTTVTTNAPRAVGWLERLNVAGACADILSSFAVAQNEETGYNPGAYWSRIYKDGKKLIQGRFLDDMGLTRTSALSAHLVSGSTYDTDGNEKHALFTRKMFEVPGETVDDEDD